MIPRAPWVLPREKTNAGLRASQDNLDSCFICSLSLSSQSLPVLAPEVPRPDLFKTICSYSNMSTSDQTGPPQEVTCLHPIPEHIFPRGPATLFWEVFGERSRIPKSMDTSIGPPMPQVDYSSQLPMSTTWEHCLGALP